MSIFQVRGEIPLKGIVIPQGSKNEALQVISAILLTIDKVRIKNIPNINDVILLINILKNLGVECTKHTNNDYTFCAKNLNLTYLNTVDFYNKFTHIRGSIMIIGPILSRFGYIAIPFPGGDKIGKRFLDTHFQGLIKLGVVFNYDHKIKKFILKVSKKGLIGGYILLEEPSVTGTANVIMSSVFAKGNTVIYNAACEPYIQQLCKMLNYMGAKIKGIGSNLLFIEGVDILRGCEHSILPDIIEIGSWIGLAAITKSELIIKNVSWSNLGNMFNVFYKLGVVLSKINIDDIFIPAQDTYQVERFIDGSILTLYDSPWPGLSPDLLSILLVVAIQAKGHILIHQKMFERRLYFVNSLIDMGANIILCDPHRVLVIGFNRTKILQSSNMYISDIRSGMALLIAALSATGGVSTLHNIEQIDRGYENIDNKLTLLGADIKRYNNY
jgi:UDP-N-acetylglucosamine 1-carboxyvinyltransferase